MEGKKIRKYVVDASVAVRRSVDEEHSDTARLLRDSYIAGGFC